MTVWVERNPLLCLFGLLGFFFVMFSLGFLASSRGAPAAYPATLPSSEYDEHLLALDRAGIEAAYQEQVKLLFKNWMNDPSSHQPQRAITGLRNAARAYIEAMDGAKKREQEFKQR